MSKTISHLRVINGGNPDGKVVYKESRFRESSAIEEAWQTLAASATGVFRMLRNRYYNVCVVHFVGGTDGG